MKKKSVLLSLVLLLVVLFVLTGCTPTNVVATQPPATATPAETATPAATATPEVTATPAATATAVPNAGADIEKVFTLAELEKFDGKDGKSAYVAINGVVYDVTIIKAWFGGVHNGLSAGKDLTVDIAKAPHGLTVIEKLPIVGKLN